MKYFVFVFIGLLAALVLSVFFVCYLFRQRLYRAVFIRKIGEFGDRYAKLPFFPTYMAVQAADIAVRASWRQRKHLFKAVYGKKFDTLISCVKKTNLSLAAALEAYFHPEGKLKQVCKMLRQIPCDTGLLLIYGLDAAAGNDFKKLRDAVDRLKRLKLNRQENALFLYLNAKLSLNDGDMFAASRDAALAAGLFKKQRALREEAAAYMLLGEIYRFCAVYDVAQMMYDSASGLYCRVPSFAGRAEVLAAKGMLLAGQERFVEATELFRTSRQTFKALKLTVKEAEVINQMALLSLMRGRLTAAVKYAWKAMDKHRALGNIQGQAYSNELVALSFLKQENYKKAADYAAAAQEGYSRVKNHASYLDAAFVAAEALFKMQKFSESAVICQKIIRAAGRYKTGFHVANAYALSGLVCLHQQDFKRAKTLFMRSLNKERASGRYSGMATDYANLAEIENCTGNFQGAKVYLSAALEEAKKYGDDDLCALIVDRLENLT